MTSLTEIQQGKKDELLLEYEVDTFLAELLNGGSLETLIESMSEELDLSYLKVLLEMEGKGKRILVKTLVISADR